MLLSLTYINMLLTGLHPETSQCQNVEKLWYQDGYDIIYLYQSNTNDNWRQMHQHNWDVYFIYSG